jgi:ABC-2 type transport system ATP-binding protein
MNVPVGSIYGLVGRNGAGKSTVMKMIAGLVAPTVGEITLFGRYGGMAGEHVEASHENASERVGGVRFGATQRVGALIENPGLLPNLGAMDNMMVQELALGVADPRTGCRELLRQVGLGEVGHRRTRGFSLGMKQRLGIAMCMLGNPDLLLLDEPLNGLDPQGARTMRNYLVQLNQTRGITIVISSHVLDQLERMCTHYGVISNGHMVREMTAEQVQSECRRSMIVRTSETAKTLAVLEDAASQGRLGSEAADREPHNPDDVRFAAEPDGSIVISGDFTTQAVASVLHSNDQEVLELASKDRDMEDYFLALMEERQ